MRTDPAGKGTRRVVFVLLDKFTFISFAAAIEPLRLANRMAERTLYAVSVASETGAPATASNGVRVEVDGPLPDLGHDATVILCGGTDIAVATTRPLLGWLRRESRRGVAMGALCTGAHALARAGLLDGRRATIHWENRDGFAEAFDEVELSSAIYVIDGDRMTAAGGLASADMMLRLIADAHGADLAAEVADQMVYSAPRGDTDRQRLSVPARIGVRHPKLSRVIALMHEHIEEPLSAAALAEAVGMSTRQLERLFRRYLSRSPKRYYLELRLEKARRLLLQTDMSVITVALACGFTSPSHFSKCYRGHYNRTPYRERGVADAASRGGVLPAAAVLPIEGPYDSAIETAPPTGADIEFDDMPDEEDDAFLDGPLDPRA
jgi:transcriptional regulator GlxA family with amidase domain